MSTDAFNILIVHTHPVSLQLPVPNDGPAGRDAAHRGAALWVGAFLHLNLNRFYFFQCYFFFLFLYQSFIFPLYFYSDVQPETKTGFLCQFASLFLSLGFLSRFCRLQGDEHGAFCQPRVILARTFSTSHS